MNCFEHGNGLSSSIKAENVLISCVAVKFIRRALHYGVSYAYKIIVYVLYFS
jgi:hypothetical protein